MPGPTLIGTVTVSPYNLAWNNVQVGTYALTAKVTDSLNATATSAVVNVDRQCRRDGEAARRVFVQRRLGDFGRRDRRCRRAQRNADGNGDLGSIAASPPKLDTCKAASFAGGAIDVAGLGVSTAAAAKTTVAFWVYWGGADAVMPIGWVTRRPELQRRLFGFTTQNSDVYGIASTGFAEQMAPRRRRIHERGRCIQQALRRRRAAGAHAARRRAQQRQRGRRVGVAHRRLERQHQLSIFGSARRGEDLQSRADGDRGERRVRGFECVRNRADRIVDRAGEQREFRRAGVDCNDCHCGGDSDRRDTDQGRVLQRRNAARYRRSRRRMPTHGPAWQSAITRSPPRRRIARARRRPPRLRRST